MYTVGILSDQVNCNFVAWVKPIQSFQSKADAIKFAIKEHYELDRKFTSREDFGNGAIKGESIVIHDGQELVSWELSMRNN